MCEPTEHNNGQNLCEPSVNVRIDVPSATLQKWKVAKINLQNVKITPILWIKYTDTPSKKYQYKLL